MNTALVEDRIRMGEHAMIISEAQKRQLIQLFNTLPKNIKGHSMRTGIALEIFTSRILVMHPEYLSNETGSVSSLHIIHCAREFGFYHHLGEMPKKAGASEDAPAAKERILSVFTDSWNSNGFYVHGLLDTIETHEEHWDGSGKPGGLRGNHIPFWGRACAIAEKYDLLTIGASMSQRKAFEQISHLSGRYFDPTLVPIFLECAKELRVVRK